MNFVYIPWHTEQKESFLAVFSLNAPPGSLSINFKIRFAGNYFLSAFGKCDLCFFKDVRRNEKIADPLKTSAALEMLYSESMALSRARVAASRRGGFGVGPTPSGLRMIQIR